MMRPGYLEPYPTTRGDTFMMRNGRPGQHRGTDTAPGAKPALFPADGVIIDVGHSAALGNTIQARFFDGMVGGIAHLAAPAPIRVGQPVLRLEAFGAMIGNTGTASSGRHMHSTLGYVKGSIYAGTTIDPLKYYADHPPSAPPPPQPKGEQLMRLIQDETTTYFLQTENGLYVIPDQARADQVYRYLNTAKAEDLQRADVEYVNSLILGPRWGAPSIVVPPGNGGGPLTIELSGTAKPAS